MRKEKDLQNVIASAKFEGMEPTAEEVKQLRKLINGEISYEQLKEEILAEFN